MDFELTYKIDFALTKDQADRLVNGCLVGELGLQQLGGEEVPELTGLVPADVLVVHVDLPQSPHHGQLEVLVIHGLVRPAGEGEAVGDLEPGVGDQAEEGALGDPAATRAGLQLVTMLDELHDHQAIYLDNLEQSTMRSSIYLLSQKRSIYLNTRFIFSILARISTGIGHLSKYSSLPKLTLDS